MKISIMKFVITILIITGISLQGCKQENINIEAQDSDKLHETQLKLQGINKDKAISVATEKFLKTVQIGKQFIAIPCEEVLFWRIIFDGSGYEYVIDKKDGHIIKVENMLHGPIGGVGDMVVDKGINEQEAIYISRKNLLVTYARKEDVEWFTVSACELAKVWRVTFDVRLTQEPEKNQPIIPSAPTWQYSIDKKTGEILQKYKS